MAKNKIYGVLKNIHGVSQIKEAFWDEELKCYSSKDGRIFVEETGPHYHYGGMQAFCSESIHDVELWHDTKRCTMRVVEKWFGLRKGFQNVC